MTPLSLFGGAARHTPTHTWFSLPDRS